MQAFESCKTRDALAIGRQDCKLHGFQVWYLNGRDPQRVCHNLRQRRIGESQRPSITSCTEPILAQTADKTQQTLSTAAICSAMPIITFRDAGADAIDTAHLLAAALAAKTSTAIITTLLVRTVRHAGTLAVHADERCNAIPAGAGTAIRPAFLVFTLGLAHACAVDASIRCSARPAGTTASIGSTLLSLASRGTDVLAQVTACVHIDFRGFIHLTFSVGRIAGIRQTVCSR